MRKISSVYVAVDLGHLVSVGGFPAQLHGGDAPINVGLECHSIEGSDRVPGTDLTGTDGIVTEILIGDIPVFVPN